MKLLIIGGVAGGASAAARARRLDESAEIVLIEKGEHISFANCGLPYHVGGTITARGSLIVMSPEAFKTRTNIDVRTSHEAIFIDRQTKKVRIVEKPTGREYDEAYDKLILAPGSKPVRPSIPGIDDPDVLTLWNIPDMDAIIKRIEAGSGSSVVVGGGFIGLEIAENLRKRGVETSLVEMLPQLMPPMDPEMSKPIEAILTANGVALHLNNGVVRIERENGELTVHLKSGGKLHAGFVVMSVGVTPNSELAKKAGLELGQRGGIVVDSHLRTSDPDIFAVGDAIQVNDLTLNKPAMIPLAGPANRQGRMAAANALGGSESYKGSLGTAVCKVFDLSVASVGANEKRLRQEGIEYQKLYLHPFSHASYYPGAEMMHVKVLFGRDGRLLGSQIVGRAGVDKRIDVLATAMRGGMKVADLEELELAYAPPYGSAKDPINFIGFNAVNILSGNSRVAYADEIPKDSFLLDVRQPEEFACGAIPGAVNIPLGKLRSRFPELPKDKPIVAYCRVGLRGYLAERILRQKGFDVKNLSGGFVTWAHFHTASPAPVGGTCDSGCRAAPEKDLETLSSTNSSAADELDARGLQCPGPIVKVVERMALIQNGHLLKVVASDKGFMKDLPAWCASTGNTLVEIKETVKGVEAVIRKGAGAAVCAPPAQTAVPPAAKRTTIVLFSNDLDKAMAAFIIATGFSTIGHEVSIFFTFWGLNVLRRDNPPPAQKDILSRMFGMMMPCGARKLALSKMHFAGMGTAMMKHVMSTKNVSSLPELVVQAQRLGVRFLACEMAMNVMGIKLEELIDGVEPAGVANFAALSEKSGATLFI